MNLFWVIALVQAAFIALCILSGQVRIRHWLLAERAVEPRRFWFCVAVFGLSLLAVVAEALHPPY